MQNVLIGCYKATRPHIPIFDPDSYEQWCILLLVIAIPAMVNVVDCRAILGRTGGSMDYVMGPTKALI